MKLIRLSTIHLLLIALCILLGVHSSFARANNDLITTALPLKKDAVVVDLNESIHYLSRSNGAAPLDPDTLLHQSNLPWKKNTQRVFNLGYTDNTVWLKASFSLSNIENRKEYLLNISYPVLDYVNVYLYQDGKPLHKWQVGDKQPFSARPVLHEHFLLPFQLEKQGYYTVLVNVKTSSAMQVPLSIWEKAHFYSQDQTRQLLLGMYFGLMGIMVIYNLLMFFSIKDQTLAYYVAYVSALSLFAFSLTGYGYRYLWPTGIWWNDQSILFFLLAAVISGTLFIIKLLDLKHTEKLLYQGCLVILLFGLLLIVTAFIIPYTIMIRVIITYSVLACIWGVIIRFIRLKGKSNLATYYSIAWSSVLIGGVILAANKFSLIPQNWFTENALLIGTSIEIACLSFAVSERINIERKKRYFAQTKALREIRRANDMLESEVESRTKELKKANDMLVKLSNTDALTQVSNRRYLNDYLEKACQSATIALHPLSLIMIDIDHFKSINDQYGHQTGDQCLSQVASRVLSCTHRQHDLVARYGGEEFCVVLPNCDHHNAFKLAEEIRVSISSEPFLLEPSLTLNITVSVGINSLSGTKVSQALLIKGADEALYHAKSSGRNQSIAAMAS